MPLSDYDLWLLPLEPEPLAGSFNIVLSGFGCEVDVHCDSVDGFAVVEVTDEQTALDALREQGLCAEDVPSSDEEWLRLGAELLEHHSESEIIEEVLEQNDVKLKWL